MRWLVEVTSLATTEKESLPVDAETWQKALQFARSQRGDTGPMSGFSIELLDDGCRAVDPTSRMRYEVRRAPEQGASVPPPPVAPATVAAAPAVATPISAPPRPNSSRRPPAGARTIMMGATVPPAVNAPVAPAAPTASAVPAGLAAPVPSIPSQPPPPPPPPPVVAAPVAPSLPIVPIVPIASVPIVGAAIAPSAPMAPLAPTAPVHAPAPSTLRADVAANVPSQIVFKREQEATDSMPLTYREYIYGVPPGTSEAAAETLLVTQLEFVRASLERAAAGKLVNLAVVDAPFEGKPKTAPLATLMWKDWRGAHSVGFPRRPSYVAPSWSAPAPAAPVVHAGQFPTMQAAPVFAAAPVSAPPQTPAFAPAPAPAPLFAPAPAFVSVPAPAAAHAFMPPAPHAISSPLLPAVAPVAPLRVRGEDLVADLFEAMHELHFLRDAIEGGDFCLTLAMEKLPSQAGIIHLYDIDRREFLVTNTRGMAAYKLLLLRHPEDEAMLAEAMRKRRALVIADADQSEAASIGRYVMLGGVHSLIIAPVMQSGRFLGAIELLNPIDGQPFTEAEGNAVMYIADQLAEFLGQRGVVTDAERISARKSSEG